LIELFFLPAYVCKEGQVRNKRQLFCVLSDKNRYQGAGNKSGNQSPKGLFKNQVTILGVELLGRQGMKMKTYKTHVEFSQHSQTG